jgi:probable rRNA maturation factor
MNRDAGRPADADRRGHFGARRLTYKIEITDLQTSLDVDPAELRRVARRVLKLEKVKRATVSIALVDDAALRRLNRRFLGHDVDTDVLSFLLECKAPRAAAARGKTGVRGRRKRIEGELVVSTQAALRRAAEFCLSPRAEVVLYVVHGLLHLVGYDDQSESEEQIMRAREQAVLGFRAPASSSDGRAASA